MFSSINTVFQLECRLGRPGLFSSSGDRVIKWIYFIYKKMERWGKIKHKYTKMIKIIIIIKLMDTMLI